MIAIVDYGMGNRRSVEKAFAHIGADAALTSDHEHIATASAIVIPGVGAFPHGMENLHRLGLDDLLRERARHGVPILGICLGMQLLFERSTEGRPADGLGLIPGGVEPLRTGGLRLPHIGWNDARVLRPHPLIAGLPSEGAAFYHVHSFVAAPDDPEDVIATCAYGESFPTIVARGSVAGVQFHPEKSSRDGLALLANFAALGDRAALVRS